MIRIYLTDDIDRVDKNLTIGAFQIKLLPHFRVRYSFGMISGCLRNDIGMFFDEK